MEKKPQLLTGHYMGHDILVRLDEVQPPVELDAIPEEIYDQIFRELLYAEDGEIDRTVMAAEEVFVRVKGSWTITIHPENLAERIGDARKAALEYVLRAMAPGSTFDWPDEGELIEWNSESGGVREGEVSSVVHKNEGNVQVCVYDNDDMCDKEINLSNFTTDGLIRIAQCVHTGMGNK